MLLRKNKRKQREIASAPPHNHNSLSLRNFFIACLLTTLLGPLTVLVSFGGEFVPATVFGFGWRTKDRNLITKLELMHQKHNYGPYYEIHYDLN